MKKEYKKPIVDIYSISASEIMQLVIGSDAEDGEKGESKNQGGSNMWEYMDNDD